MKNYRVTVNGVAYDVVVEELNGSSAPAPVAAAPVAAPVAASKAAPAPASCFCCNCRWSYHDFE